MPPAIAATMGFGAFATARHHALAAARKFERRSRREIREFRNVGRRPHTLARLL